MPGAALRFALLTILTLIGVGASAAEPPALVIQGGALFDSASATMKPNRTLVIRGGKIQSIHASDEKIELPAGAIVLDAHGKYLIPGLIDAHVHLVHRLNFAHVTGDEILPLFLAAGVTAVRDTGDEIVAETLVARFADAHPETCPRVFKASYLIDADPPIHRDIGWPLTVPAKVPALVDDMLTWNVRTLKIYAGSTRAVGRVVIQEGHRRGLVVTGHLGGYPAQEAVEDGIDCIEHITSVFDFVIPAEVRKQPDHRATVDLANPQARALLRQLAQRKVFVDPTLTVFRNMLLLSDTEEVQKHPDNALMPARLRNYWHQYRQGQGLSAAGRDQRRQVFRKYQELTGLLFKAGVPLLAGTDAPEPFCPPGFSLHQELEYLVESGVPAAAALQAATLHNARVLKEAERLGTIEPGKLADVVVLDADPLADIRNSRKIYRVIKAGKILEPQTLLKAVPVQ